MKRLPISKRFIISASSVIAVIVIFSLFFSFNIQFKDFVLTIYYKIIPERTSYQSQVFSCEDSELIKDYFSKGIIHLTYKNGITDIYADSCKDSTLTEYSCLLNNLVTEEYSCESGCYEGACLTPEDFPAVIDSNLSKFCKSYRITSPLNAIAQSEHGLFTAINAIDGDLTSNWFGDPAHPFPKWIYFDFANKVCISELDLYSFKLDLPITANIQASQDTIHWSTILQNITITNQTTTLVFPEIVTARYVRLYELSSNRTFGSLTDARFKIADLPDFELQ